MQMAERTDSKIVARKDDHIEVTSLKFNGMLDSIEKFMNRLSKSVASARFSCLFLLGLCINIYCATLGNVVRVYPWIVQGLTFLSA